MALPTPIEVHTIGGFRQNHEAWHEQLHDESNKTAATVGNVVTGTGTPEGTVTAPIGVFYIDLGGGSGVTLWIKEANVDDTGWRSVDTTVA
jgi:nicotinamide mononucleotide (NMN) deamidase PncC